MKTINISGNVCQKLLKWAIWIDSQMKDGQVWTKEDEGLLFLFSNKETFRRVYNKEGIEIWEVRK